MLVTGLVVGYIVVALMNKGAHGKCYNAGDEFTALFLSVFWPLCWAMLLVAVLSKAAMCLGAATLGKAITWVYDYL